MIHAPEGAERALASLPRAAAAVATAGVNRTAAGDG